MKGIIFINGMFLLESFILFLMPHIYTPTITNQGLYVEQVQTYAFAVSVVLLPYWISLFFIRRILPFNIWQSLMIVEVLFFELVDCYDYAANGNLRSTYFDWWAYGIVMAFLIACYVVHVNDYKLRRMFEKIRR